MLEAQPPAGHELTKEDLDRSVEIMRNRVDKLGVSEPEIRKQSNNQIVIQLPDVHDQDQAAEIIGQTAQLELYDLETSLVPPSVDAAQNPVAFTSLYNLLTRVQSGQEGKPAQYWLFNSRTKQLVPNVSPTETLAQLKNSPRVKALKPLKGKNAANLPTTPGFPTGYQLMTTPKNRVIITCSAETSVVCPGLPDYPAEDTTYYYLFEHDLNAEPPSPAMTGTELKLDGTRQDFDPSTGAADRDAPVHRSRATTRFHDITQGRGVPRPAARDPAALRDRARRRDPLVPADRLRALSGRDRPDRRRRADHGARVAR